MSRFVSKSLRQRPKRSSAAPGSQQPREKAPKARTLASGKKKAAPAKVRIHQSGEGVPPSPPVRQIPWWLFPLNENDRAHLPGGPGHGSGGGPGHGPGGPGHGPGGGPGHGPGGPGHGPGHGPFPPGPFPPGPGPFPPGPFPPGPGPFPPPRPPFPFPLPLPLPLPIPVPFPTPIPGPVPVPTPTPATVSIQIDGGFAFPSATQSTYATYYPGLTIGQALAQTGLVTIAGGSIVSAAGIPTVGNVGVRLRYNGRVIPQTLLNQPVDPYSTIGLEIYTF